MGISAATSSQNNRSGSGRFTPIRRKTSKAGAVAQMDTADLMTTLNLIDDKNIRTTFKQAKDPVYLAFDHIDSQPLAKVAQDAFKIAIDDVTGGVENSKDAFAEIVETFGDFFEFVTKIFTTDEEFIPEKI